MIERKAGWYWVKLDGEWYASQYRPGYTRGGDGVEAPWSFGILLSLEEIQFEEIGPRIPTPDEPWQCAPVVPTDEMVAAYTRNGGDIENANFDWQTMLQAAPQP